MKIHLQNLNNNFDVTKNVSTIIKWDTEIGANCQYQIPTTSSASLNNEEEDEGDELNGLHRFVADANTGPKDDGFEGGGSTSVQIDLDREMNGTR